MNLTPGVVVAEVWLNPGKTARASPGMDPETVAVKRRHCCGPVPMAKALVAKENLQAAAREEVSQVEAEVSAGKAARLLLQFAGMLASLCRRGGVRLRYMV